MRANPYRVVIENIRQVMKKLIELMCDPTVEMPIFRNMAAVYVFWQADLHLAQIAAMNWDMQHDRP